MAKRNSKLCEWTKTDVRELKTLARQKPPARKIARTLKSTTIAFFKASMRSTSPLRAYLASRSLSHLLSRATSRADADQ
jgi:hypothetical protein